MTSQELTRTPANDNDYFQGKSPFKGFRNEALDDEDDLPENVIKFWWWANPCIF